jgi:hypothetical protein
MLENDGREFSDLTPPVPTRGDKAATFAKRALKGVAGAVPLAGGMAAEIVDVLFRIPLQERRQK